MTEKSSKPSFMSVAAVILGVSLAFIAKSQEGAEANPCPGIPTQKETPKQQPLFQRANDGVWGHGNGLY
jgi:hypothetical protein